MQEEADRINLFHSNLIDFHSGIKAESDLSYSDIEGIAISLQRIIWTYRDVIWKSSPHNPVDLLQPEVILKKLGYQFHRATTLGQHEVQGDIFEIAGQIDKQNKVVSISKQFSSETQNFTAAHELGHALLHQQNILHRDKALDGSSNRNSRNLTELQADKFASYFLMPTKQVKKIFQELFLTQKFVLNEATAFAINQGKIYDLRKKYKNLREFARYLSSVEYFNNRTFQSISKQFGVSVETMAIRLEELNLIKY